MIAKTMLNLGMYGVGVFLLINGHATVAYWVLGASCFCSLGLVFD